MKIWIIESEHGDIYCEDLSEALRTYKAMRRNEKIRMRSFEISAEKWWDKQLKDFTNA